MFNKKKESKNILYIDKLNSFFKEIGLNFIFFINNNIPYIKVGDRMEILTYYFEENDIQLVEGNIVIMSEKEVDFFNKNVLYFIKTYAKKYDKKINSFVKIKNEIKSEHNFFEIHLILEKENLFLAIYLNGLYFVISKISFSDNSYIELFEASAFLGNNRYLLFENGESNIFKIDTEDKKVLKFYMDVKRQISSFKEENTNKNKIY